MSHRVEEYGIMIDTAHPVKYRAIILYAYNRESLPFRFAYVTYKAHKSH